MPIIKEVIPPIMDQEGGLIYLNGYAIHDPSPNDALPFTNCKIVLDANEIKTWDWDEFCTIIVHEFGHLTGHKHVDNIAKVMNPYYILPFPKCVKAHHEGG